MAIRVLMASDAPPEHHAPAQGFGRVSVKDPAEAERVLSPGRKRHDPDAHRADLWSVRFGMLTDQFGMPWMVNCEQAASRAIF